MAKKNTIPVRLDADLAAMIKKNAKKYGLSEPQMSRELYEEWKQLKIAQKKIKKEIEF